MADVAHTIAFVAGSDYKLGGTRCNTRRKITITTDTGDYGADSGTRLTEMTPQALGCPQAVVSAVVINARDDASMPLFVFDLENPQAPILRAYRTTGDVNSVLEELASGEAFAAQTIEVIVEGF